MEIEKNDKAIIIIAEEIATLVHRTVKRIEYDEQKYKNQYDSVMSELEDEIKQIESSIIYFKEEKLTFNAIEQEGYLRCLKQMVDRFRSWEE
jgi:tRNA A37 N6-isopentenylltransferase MiaA